MTTLELCERADLKEAARKLALPDAPVRLFVHQLARGGMTEDAISALAHLLPKRGCIAWGLNCVRKVSAASSPPSSGPVFHAVEQWLADPTDELRRAAYQIGERVGLGTPGGALTLAVFLSGGTMAPAEAPVLPIEPAPHLCGKTITIALAAAVALDPRNAAQLRSAFVDRGLHMAEELKIWEQEK